MALNRLMNAWISSQKCRYHCQHHHFILCAFSKTAVMLTSHCGSIWYLVEFLQQILSWYSAFFFFMVDVALISQSSQYCLINRAHSMGLKLSACSPNHLIQVHSQISRRIIIKIASISYSVSRIFVWCIILLLKKSYL